MKRRRILTLALLLAFPLALFAYVSNLNSWRPKTIDLSGIRVEWMVFSPDGRYLLATDATREVSSDIIVCDVNTRRIMGKIPESSGPLFLEHVKQVAVQSGSMNKNDSWRTRVLAFPSLQVLKEQSPKSLDSSVIFSEVWPDAETLAGHDKWGNIILWRPRTETKETISLPLRAKSQYFVLQFLPDNKTITFNAHDEQTSSSRNLQFWDVATKKCRFVVNNYPVSFSCAANGLWAKWNPTGGVEIGDYHTGKLKRVIRGDVSEPVLSPDGVMLATANGYFGKSKCSKVTLWDTATGQRLRVIESQRDTIICLAFSPDGRTLAVANYYGFVQLWRVK